MKINEIFKDDGTITLEKYLNHFGITDIKEYLKPTGKYIEPPMLYINMIEAVQCFKYHYLQNDKAYILCDSGDTDGITSTTIMYKYMRRLNPKWDIKILIHRGKQRGLQDKELLNKILSEPRPLIIIPDSGTNEKEQTNELSKLNISVLVLDHHSLDTPIESGVLVNNQMGKVDKCGSGCVVTHKFLQALDNEFNVKYSSDLIDMVALSVISDGMNVASMQNRTYLYYGLFKSNKMIKNEFLYMMFEKFVGVDKKTNELKDYDQHKISFTIVPKINACCRSDNQQLKQNMIMAFIGIGESKLSMTYEEILDELAKLHRSQIDYVNKYIEDNLELIDKTNDIIIYSDKDIVRSNSGLLAGRIKDRCDNKPVIIGKDFDGKMIGSLRSDAPLKDEINSSGLAEGKGHTKQCGIIMDVENIPKLIDYINSLHIDYTADTDVLKSYMVNSIPNQLYGLYDGLNDIWSDNTLPQPMFHIKNIKINNTDIKILGAKGGTIKFRCGDVDFIKFDNSRKLKEDLKLRKYNGDEFEEIDKEEILNIEVIGFPTINEYGRYKNKQIVIKELEVTKPKEITLNDLF